MRASWSVQSTVRRLPSASAIRIISPVGVATRSINSSSCSCGIGCKPQMLFGVSVPRPPCCRSPAVEIGGRDLDVPVAGSAHARTLGDKGCELGIAREMAVDRENVGAEIEYALHAGHDSGQGTHLG